MEKYRWEKGGGDLERETDTLLASLSLFGEPQWATSLTGGIVTAAGGNRIAVKESSPLGVSVIRSLLIGPVNPPHPYIPTLTPNPVPPRLPVGPMFRPIKTGP